MAHMTQQEREKNTAFFKAAAGDGTLSALELKRHLESLGGDFTFKDIAEFYNAIDLNNDHEVTLQEFLDALDNSGVQREKLKQVFSQLDTSGDGKLTRDELQAGLSTLCDKGVEIDEAHAQEILEKVDADGDGRVSIEEFVNAILQ